MANETFEARVSKVHEAAYWIGLQMLKSKADAEDVAQDTSAKILPMLRREPEKSLAYFRKVARSIAIDIIRKRPKFVYLEEATLTRLLESAKAADDATEDDRILEKSEELLEGDRLAASLGRLKAQRLFYPKTTRDLPPDALDDQDACAKARKQQLWRLELPRLPQIRLAFPTMNPRQRCPA